MKKIALNGKNEEGKFANTNFPKENYADILALQ